MKKTHKEIEDETKSNEFTENKTNDYEGENIQSDTAMYCPDCDIFFRCCELLIYRNHCKVEHGWFCCELRNKREGCDFVSTTKHELKKHMLVCNFFKS